MASESAKEEEEFSLHEFEEEDSNLYEALGVNKAGKCVRHPTYPVLQEGNVVPCRVCFSQEKSVGIQTLQEVVQELHKSNSSFSSHGSVEEKLGQQPLESVLKRLSQVQNWHLREKEQQIASLQRHIRKLDDRLNEETQSNQELKNTIKGLRKAIQQDMKVIKTMQETSPQKNGPMTPSPHKHLADRELIPDDEEVVSKLQSLKAAFTSFRGGLLDIPKSPPAARHDREEKKLQLNRNAREALKLRALSRNNSSAPGNQGNSSKEIPLDVLAAKLSELPVQRKILGQSPEQFFPETVPGDPEMPKAMPLDSINDTILEVTESELDDTDQQPKEETNCSKCVFTVTGAASQDKFGDPGRYNGQILVTTGLPHGSGKMEYESGRVYEGDWVSGQWHGKGKLQNSNGDTYEGDFYLDARHGNGVYRWDNLDVYTGAFHSDKRHGKGTFEFSNGNRYTGEFSNGMFEGFGKYEFTGGYYEGDWKGGRYDGSGELQYANGGMYRGEFRNSLAHGFGMEVLPDGRKRRGVWAEGKPTEYFDDQKKEELDPSTLD